MVSSLSWQNEMTHINNNANKNQTDDEIDDKKISVPRSRPFKKYRLLCYPLLWFGCCDK